MSRQAIKLRDQAAGPTRRRLGADRREASPELKPVLAVIAARLFDRDFDVNALWRECGVKKWAGTAFAEQVGMRPAAYISSLRLEVGAALLRGSELKVLEIAEVLGYSAGQDTFSRAFQRRHGKTPLRYRREARAEGEPVVLGSDPALTELIDGVDRSTAAGDLAGARRGLAHAEALLRDRHVADLAARLGVSLHERGVDRTRAGDVDGAYDDLNLARECYAAAGELPPSIARQQRYFPVSQHTDEALLSALCADCRQRLATRVGRSMRAHLRQALIAAPRHDPWFEASCDDCYRVAWAALSRARLGLMNDALKAWWLSSNVDVKDRGCPPSRGRFIAAMAEVERLYLGSQLERKGYADIAVEDAVALGDPLLEAESRMWLSAVLGAMSEFADAKEQLALAGESGSSRWLSALRNRMTGLLAFRRSKFPTALQLLESSTELYRDLDPHVSGLLVLQQANVYFEVADYERFVALNEQALAVLDRRRDPLPADGMVPIHLARAFGLLGDREKAERALSRCRFERSEHRGLAATEVMTRACLALLGGPMSDAVGLFADARERFQELNIPSSAALAASYSVEAYARLGQVSRAIETAVAALSFFQAAGCTEEAFEALGRLRSLLEAEVIDAAAVTAKVRSLARRYGGWLPEPGSGQKGTARGVWLSHGPYDPIASMA